jgi:hypothetical protein
VAKLKKRELSLEKKDMQLNNYIKQATVKQTINR